MQGFWYTDGIYSYNLALNSQENIKFMIHIVCLCVWKGGVDKYDYVSGLRSVCWCLIYIGGQNESTMSARYGCTWKKFVIYFI